MINRCDTSSTELSDELRVRHQALLHLFWLLINGIVSSSIQGAIEIDSLFGGIDFYTSITRAKFEDSVLFLSLTFSKDPYFLNLLKFGR